MKGYRRLAPGELPRDGDRRTHEGHGYVNDLEGNRDAIAGNIVIWRKVRTEGCPPGWRWDDGGEEYSHKLIGGEAVEISSDILLAGRSQPGSVLQRLQPYPEDERLQE